MKRKEERKKKDFTHWCETTLLSISALHQSRNRKQRVHVVSRTIKSMLPIGWGLGDSLGSKKKSCKNE